MDREPQTKYSDPSKETRYGFLRDQGYRAIKLEKADDFRQTSH